MLRGEHHSPQIWAALGGALALLLLACARAHRRQLRIVVAKLCHHLPRALAQLLAPSLLTHLALVVMADVAVLLLVLAIGDFLLADLHLPLVLSGGALLTYLCGCLIAAHEPRRFVARFEAKVRLAEVSGLSPLDVCRVREGLQRRLRQPRQPRRGRREGHPDGARDGGHAARLPDGASSRRLLGVDTSVAALVPPTPGGGTTQQLGSHRAPRNGLLRRAWAWLRGPVGRTRAGCTHRAIECALFRLCCERGLAHAFQRERALHAVRTMTLSQSIPGLRLLLLLSWQPRVTPLDVSGTLNALVLYSCTVGLPCLTIAVYVHTPYAPAEYARFAYTPRFVGLLVCHALCGSLALASILLDLPQRLLVRHARRVDGDDTRALTSHEGMQAAAEYIRRVAEKALVLARNTCVAAPERAGAQLAIPVAGDVTGGDLTSAAAAPSSAPASTSAAASIAASAAPGDSGPSADTRAGSLEDVLQEAERSILTQLFALKQEQVFCMQRQLWTDEQLAQAAHASFFEAGAHALPRRRSVVAPRRVLAMPASFPGQDLPLQLADTMPASDAPAAAFLVNSDRYDHGRLRPKLIWWPWE